jgi:amidase
LSPLKFFFCIFKFAETLLPLWLQGASHQAILRLHGLVLTLNALRGKRIGVLEDLLLVDPEDTEVAAVIGHAAAELRGLGAELIRVHIADFAELTATRIDGFFVLVYDFRHDIEAYLARHEDAPVKTLEEVLVSGRYHPALDENLRLSLAMDEDSLPDYQAELAHRSVFRNAVLDVMAREDLDALMYPTLRQKAALLGEVQMGGNCQLSSNTGLPAVTVPAGFTLDGLPVGLELLGRAWSESSLLAMAYAYEQSTRHRRAPALATETAAGEPSASPEIDDNKGDIDEWSGHVAGEEELLDLGYRCEW